MASAKSPRKEQRAGTADRFRKAGKPPVPKRKIPPKKPATRLSRDL
jgi:hypothetical protein